MENERGRSVERLVAFTDAVVAIAVTLLALPLIEVPDPAPPLAELLGEKWPSLLGFVISFLVIARLWWAHHRIFSHVLRWSPALVRLTVGWLFTIAVLPAATAVTTSYNPYRQHVAGLEVRGPIAIYLAVMAASSALLTAMAVVVARNEALTDGQDEDARRRLANSVETTVGFALALVIGTAFPVVNYFALVVLVVTGRVGEVVQRRRRRVT